MFCGLVDGVSLRAAFLAGLNASNQSAPDFSAALQNQHTAQPPNAQLLPEVYGTGDYHALHAVGRGQQQREASSPAIETLPNNPPSNTTANAEQPGPSTAPHAGYRSIAANQVDDHMVAHLPASQQQAAKQHIASALNTMAELIDQRKKNEILDSPEIRQQFFTQGMAVGKYDPTGTINMTLGAAQVKLGLKNIFGFSVENGWASFQKELNNIISFVQSGAISK
jgi:hypothetical protein